MIRSASRKVWLAAKGQAGAGDAERGRGKRDGCRQMGELPQKPNLSTRLTTQSVDLEVHLPSVIYADTGREIDPIASACPDSGDLKTQRWLVRPNKRINW